MIVITGAAGFIGSCLAGKLLQEGFTDIVAVDDFSREDKNKNLEGKDITQRVDRKEFFKWLEHNHKLVQFIFHIGARTDTAEFNEELLFELNLEFTKKVWEACIKHGLPVVYASSAATYGSGALGYDDNHEIIPKLKPLNPYGVSKNEFDKWALKQESQPYYWIGLKFFNVYGPNEYHKGRMANVVYHAFKQAHQEGEVRLFRSHREDYKDGEQKRDFIYVKDVVDVLYFLMQNRRPENNGIYNLGTGLASTFLEVAHSIFKALDKPENIKFIDTPEDIRDKYQYFTEAKMEKLRSIGYNEPFTGIEEGVKDYVQNYLLENRYF